jgi:hypothetical protein
MSEHQQFAGTHEHAKACEFLVLLFNMIPGYKALYNMNPCELREILTTLNDQLKEKIMQEYDTDVSKSRDYKGMLQTDSSEDDD